MNPVTVLAPEPGTTAIGPEDVHAWLVDLDTWPATRAVLAASERDRSASYLRPQDGVRFAASRGAVRVILSAYLGCEPERVRFADDGGGQPRLAAGHSLQFSVSRSGDIALLAVSPDPVGADLERVRPRPGLADLVTARFPAAEAACVAAGCAGSPTRSFYRHWVAKEAYIKATGRGLAVLRDAELECGPAPVIRFRGMAEPGWKVSLTEALPGYAAAIVAARPVTSWQRITG
ncbi:MAG TPA: 4'-phosphopantetheinyl transferase superfamily protein [Streptosporangiaceae bacterium]|jgi:4'-phosphopantetheinyl transferase